MFPNDDLMPRERDALEKKRPPAPPASVAQTPAPAAVVECQKCGVRHLVHEGCPSCGRRVLLG